MKYSVFLFVVAIFLFFIQSSLVSSQTVGGEENTSKPVKNYPYRKPPPLTADELVIKKPSLTQSHFDIWVHSIVSIYSLITSF